MKIPTTGNPVCPVCKSHADLFTREEQDSDGPGGTTFAFMKCESQNCGIRSREMIAYRENKERLMAEWTPNASRQRIGGKGENNE